MMPQKRNPDMLELIRGRCGNVYGDLFALMTILKGLPIGYNRDLQEDKRIVFRAYDTVSSCLTMAAAIVNSASYDKARIEPTLDRGFLDATSLAEYLVTRGSPSARPTTSSAAWSPGASGRASTRWRSCRSASFNDAIGDRSAVPGDGRRLHLPRGGQRGQAVPERRGRRRQAVRGPAGGVEAAAGGVTTSKPTGRLCHLVTINVPFGHVHQSASEKEAGVTRGGRSPGTGARRRPARDGRPDRVRPGRRRARPDRQ